jgi:hypothetical protein
VGEKSLLCFFQETILKQVKEVMQQWHGLQLLPQDESIFSKINVAELMTQLKLN